MKKMQDSSTTETKKTLKSYQFTKINMKMRSIHYQKLKKKEWAPIQRCQNSPKIYKSWTLTDTDLEKMTLSIKWAWKDHLGRTTFKLEIASWNCEKSETEPQHHILYKICFRILMTHIIVLFLFGSGFSLVLD